MLRRSILLMVMVALVAVMDAKGEVIERVIVKVNGEVITLSELQSRQFAAIQAARVPMERVDDFLREHNQEILQEAIDDLLIAQRSAEIDGDVAEEQLKQALAGIQKDFGIGDNAEFEKAIEREGMTREELKRNIARSILVRRFFVREVEPKIAVSDADARAYYESRKSGEYTLPTAVELQEILIPAERGDSAAREIAARARAGEDFAALARAHSSASTAASGGQLGRVVLRDLHRDLARVISSLTPGQVSDPVTTRAGFQILKLVSREEERVVPFDEVKESILRILKQRSEEEVVTKIVAKLRENATIEDRVREVPLQVSAQKAPPAALTAPSLREAASTAEEKPSAASAASTTADEEFAVTPMDKPLKGVVGRPEEGPPPGADKPPNQ